MALKALLPLIAQISLGLIVLSIGLRSRWGDLAFPLRHPGLLLRSILAVNIIVPVVAVVAASQIPAPAPVRAGIILMALSPLAPFVPGKMLKAGVGTDYVVGLYSALLVISVLLVPVSVAILGAWFGIEIALPPSVLAMFVFQTVLVPLLAGILIASLAPGFAARAAPLAQAIGTLVVLPIVLLILWVAGGAVMALAQDGTVLAIVITVVAALAAGHFLGGPGPAYGMALAIAAATRHPGIAGLIANRNFEDKRVMLTVVLFLLVSIVLSALYQAWAVRRLPAATATEAR